MKLRWAVVALAATATPCLPAQTPAGDTLRFSLERSGPAAAHYALQLQQGTGAGLYLPAAPAGDGAAHPGADAGVPAAPGVAGVPIHVSAEVLGKAFAAAPLVESNRCASHRKGIAQTGTKTLRLEQAGREFSCTYNYSDEERVNNATAVFEALAETLQIGDRLANKLRFDRLGLDAEMEALQAELAAGRALEVRNIAPILQALQDDDRVMERVRRRATQLLEGAGVDAQSSDPPAIKAR